MQPALNIHRPGDKHLINEGLDWFQSRTSPTDRDTIKHVLCENYHLPAALFFCQMRNPDLAYRLGIRIAERLLPLCVATDSKGRVIEDLRPQQLLTHVKTYLATGNWEEMQKAKELSGNLSNTHIHLPRQNNHGAVQVVTDLSGGPWCYQLTGTVWYAVRAYETSNEVQEFIDWLNEAVVWMFAAIQRNAQSAQYEAINQTLLAEYDQKGTPQRKRILWATDRYPLFPSEEEKKAILADEEAARQPPPAVHVTGSREKSEKNLELAEQRIKALTDDRLAELAARIRPVVLNDDDEQVLCYIKPCDLRKVAFTSSPKFTGPARDLVEIARIFTYHSYGAPVFFKPSIAEVLAQIPDEYLDRVVAFQTMSDGLTAANCVGSYHETVTVLYGRVE